ncbi:hypothetical protein C8K44_1438 [Aminobacter sp. AP02]|nr:hypothetical protein C8K44_1438 [Aminobacter sp. AP02]
MPTIPDTLELPFDGCSFEAIVQATMFYPAQDDARKRHHLACHFDVSANINIDAIGQDDAITISGRRLRTLYLARCFDDFGSSYEDLLASGYYAAHWLRYRLYAAQTYNALGTNNRWQFYMLDEIVHKIPATWPKGRKFIDTARVGYAPVAHLWLAWYDQYHEGLNLFVTKIPPAPNFRGPRFRQAGVERLLRRSKSYFEAARAADLYRGRDGLPGLDAVWQLPDFVVGDPLPEVATPDLLVPDFDPDDTFGRYEFCRAGN